MQILCFCLSKGTQCVSQRCCDCRHSSLRGMTKNNHFRPCQHMVVHFRWCHLPSTRFSHKHWQTARYSHCELTFREVVHNSLVIITQQGFEIVRQVYNSSLERYCTFNNCFALFSNRYISVETRGCANVLHLHPISKFKPDSERGGVGSKPPIFKSFLCCLTHLSQSAWCTKLTDPKTSKIQSKDKGTFHEYCIFRCPMSVLSIRGKIVVRSTNRNVKLLTLHETYRVSLPKNENYPIIY